MRWLPRVLALCFIIALCMMVVVHKYNRPRILVLHSYQTDYLWVSDIDTGLRRVLDGHKDLLVRYHYMDLKNHRDPDFIRTAANAANLMVRDFRPDILIIFDDLGQELVGSRYLDDPTMAIVFAGVNGDEQAYGYHRATNVTGLLERKPLPAIRETLLMIAQAQGKAPTEARVVFLGDRSESIAKEIPYLSSIDWAPLHWQPPVQVDTFDDWKEAVRQAGDTADLLLVTNYRQLRDPANPRVFVKPDLVMAWTEANATVPVIGMNAFNVDDGAMLAVATSPLEHGETAAALALAILGGKKVADLPIEENRQFLIAVRKSAMDRRRLPIPAIYEAFARATNNFHP